MASFILSTFARTALANDSGLNSLLDAGELHIRTAANGGGDLLVTFNLPAAANNTPANGVLTFGSIASANGANAGNAAYAQFYNNGAANLVADADCGTGSNTVVFDNVNIAVDQVVSITAANITVPAGV